jgi:bifunctional non-homologous end joining protein LigD
MAVPSLSTYNQKRNFQETLEPPGHKVAPSGYSYVIQKHAARRLHFDFRLELDGVLLSWAVPKGPSLNPKVKRLAVQTEDHPVAYGRFEGTIPKGEYGAGTVKVWDTGTWEPEGDARQEYQKGKLKFTLHGKRYHGKWHLVRTKTGKADMPHWLLFKGTDSVGKKNTSPRVKEKKLRVKVDPLPDNIEVQKAMLSTNVPGSA